MDAEDDIRRTARQFVAMYAVIAVLAVGALGVGMAMGHGSDGSQHAMMAGFDPMVMPAPIPAHYLFAQRHMGLMSQVPCYCGCQAFLSHRHLGDCFVMPDGGWESHASGCAVCTDEAAIVERLLAEGRSPPAIREAVISQFEQP